MFEEKQEHHRRKSKIQGGQQKIRKEIKQAKQTWIEEQCANSEDCLVNNNTKKAFQLVKDLTKQKHSKISTIQDKGGNYFTEGKDMNRWMECCLELYNIQNKGDPTVLDCQELIK